MTPAAGSYGAPATVTGNHTVAAQVTDVQQGQLGDCYFPSAMAALAQRARLLSDQRDPIAVSHGTVEGMRETQNGIVDQDFDVLRQLATSRVPQGLSEQGMAIAHLAENAPHAGVGRHVLPKQLSTRSVASHEPRDPGHDLDGDVTDCGLRIANCGIVCAHGRFHVPHRGGIRNSRPSARNVSGRGRPVFRS